MPSARASQGRASRSPSPSQPPAVPGEPVSCERIVTTTAAYLEAQPETVPTQCFTESYSVGRLEPNLGARVGHSLVLSPDQRTLCVVAGLRVLVGKAGEGCAEAYQLASADEESDTDTITPAAEEAKAPVPVPTTTAASKATARASSPSPARVASAPAKPAARSAKSREAPEARPATTTAPTAATTSPVSPTPARSSSVTPRFGTAGTLEVRPREAAPLPTVPAAWRTRLPIVECLDLDEHIWFTPLGEQRRAAAIVEADKDDGTSGGGIRWPAQSVAAVLWEPRLVRAPPTTVMTTTATTTHTALTPSPPPVAPLSAAARTSGAHPAAAAATAAPIKAPIKAPPITRAKTSGRADTATTARAPTKAAKTTGLAATAAPAASSSPAPGTLSMPPVPPVAKDGAREKRRQQQAAKLAEEAQRAEAKRQRRAEAQRRRDARWSVSATDVVLFGGWQKGRRLPTAMTYGVDAMDASASAAAAAESTSLRDVIHGSLPVVEMLTGSPWLPVTGHSGTVVRGKYFVFGGNAATGSTNDLYVFENARLRATYEAAAQRAVAEETKHLNMTFRSRNSITLGGSYYATEMRDGLVCVGHPDGPHHRADTGVPPDVAWSCTLVGGHRYDSLHEAAAASLTQALTSPSRLTTAEASRVDSVAPPTAVAAARVASSSRLLRSRPGSQYGPGGEPAGRAGMCSASVSVLAAASPVVSAPAPAARTSHCAASLANRFLIVFGGRQLAQTSGGSGLAGSGANGGAAGAAGKPGSSRSRGKSQAKGRNTAAATATTAEEDSALPALTLLDDLAAFDTETGVWVQVRVSGAYSPCARYAAALCALPFSPGADRGRFPPLMALRALNSPSTESAYAQRELFLHGGIDAAGHVLNDAWLLQATGKHGAWFLERDPKTGVSVLAVRWIAVRAELTVAQLLPHLARPSDPIEEDVQEASTGKKKKQNPSGSIGKNAAADAAKALHAQLMSTKVSVLPHRAHHAVIANVLRDVFIVGGEGPPLKVSLDVDEAVGDAAAVQAQLEQVVNAHKVGDLHTLRIRPLDMVEETTVDRAHAKSKGREKA